MSNLHELYVQHLINGHRPVRTSGGAIVSFTPMEGEGWFGDVAKSAWNGTKSFFNNHVKPIFASAGNELKDIGSKALAHGALAALDDSPMSIQDRLKHAGRTAHYNFAKDTANLSKQGRQMVRRKLVRAMKK